MKHNDKSLNCNNGALSGASISVSFDTIQNLLQTGLMLIKCLHGITGTYTLNVTERRSSIECLKLITSNPILQSSLSNSNIYSLSSGWVVGTQTVLDRAAKSLSKLSCLKRFYLEISVTFCGYDAPDV